MSEYADSSSGDRLSFTVFLAIALHAILILGITFTIDKGTKIAPTLNITLATHQSKVAPEKADFIAQANQEASGSEKEVKELTTRKNAEIADVNIREVNPLPSQRATTRVVTQRRIISTEQEKEEKVAKLEKPELSEESEAKAGQEIDAPLYNPEIASLRAKLDKIKEYRAKQPRIRRLTSVSTKFSYDAAYLNNWAQKFEAIGNTHFPETAIKNRIFGNLRLLVVLLPNGAVKRVKILQSSGHTILDNAAKQFVKLAEPFDPFPAEIAKSTDQLEIYRTVKFEITGLSTSK